MNKKNLISFLIILSTSCNILNHSRFSYHEQFAETQTAFKTNGVYYKFEEYHSVYGDDRYYASLFYFYKDGSIINTSLTIKNSGDKDILPKLTSEFNKRIELAYRTGGAYIISGDTLKTQMFESTGQRGMYSENVVEYRFIFNKKSDSIRLISSFCEWCSKDRKKKMAMEIPEERYNFLPLTIKPDSSKIWFKRTKWYRKEVAGK